MPDQRRITPLVSALCTTLAGAACESPARDGAGITRTDSAGITIVTSHGAERTLDWSMDSVFAVGGEEDGPEAFARVFETGIGVDAAGNLYVLDSGNYRVHVFDGAGVFVRSVGGQGGGPGEFRFPSDLAVAPDGAVAVFDYDKGGFVRFAPDGSPIGELRVAGNFQRKVAATEVGLLGVTADVTTGSDTMRLLVLGDTVRPITTVEGASPKAVPFPCMTIAIPPIFSPAIVWTARGDRIGVNDRPAYEVREYRGARPAAIYRRDVEAVRATAVLAGRELGVDSMRMVAGSGRCAVAAAEAAEAAGFAENVPPIRNLMLAPDGSWWVLRRVPGPENNRIDILSDEGEYVGTLPAGSPWPAAFRSADEIVALERSDLGVARIVVYRVRRNGD